MTCPNCGEWMEIWSNVSSPPARFCPICGKEVEFDEEVGVRVPDKEEDRG